MPIRTAKMCCSERRLLMAEPGGARIVCWRPCGAVRVMRRDVLSAPTACDFFITQPTEPRISPCWTRAKTRDSPLELALALSEPQPKSVAPAPSSGLAARSPSRFPPARRAWPVPSAATKGAISHDGGAVIPCDHEDLLAAPRSSRRVAAGRPGPPQPGARMDESSTLPSSQRAPSSQRSLVKDVSHPSNAAPPGAGLAWHRASDPRSAASSRQDERRILRYSRRFSSRRRSQWK